MSHPTLVIGLVTAFVTILVAWLLKPRLMKHLEH